LAIRGFVILSAFGILLSLPLEICKISPLPQQSAPLLLRSLTLADLHFGANVRYMKFCAGGILNFTSRRVEAGGID